MDNGCEDMIRSSQNGIPSFPKHRQPNFPIHTPVHPNRRAPKLLVIMIILWVLRLLGVELLCQIGVVEIIVILVCFGMVNVMLH